MEKQINNAEDSEDKEPIKSEKKMDSKRPRRRRRRIIRW